MPDHGRKKGFYLRQRREMMGQIEEQLKEEKALGNNCRAVGTGDHASAPDQSLNLGPGNQTDSTNRDP
jgi:hypothetical protein